MQNDEIALIINTPSGRGFHTDEGKIRSLAVQLGITCITTLPAAEAAVHACRALRQRAIQVCSLQERFPDYLHKLRTVQSALRPIRSL